MDCSLEELVVALADTLWKGVRHPDLEQRVHAAVMSETRADYWTLLIALDDVYEEIAGRGAERLNRSTERPIA